MSRAMFRRPRLRALSALVLAALTLPAVAQQVLIRGATVHTATSQGTLRNTDVLVQGGVIRAIGTGLAVPTHGRVVEAKGRPLTPALFGGITEIGIEEVSGEAATVDSGVKLTEQPMRPEFDVTLAYNPDSVLIRWHAWKASASPRSGRPPAARSSPAKAASCAWMAARIRSARMPCSFVWVRPRRT